MLFEQLNIIPPILKALKNEHYLTPTPIQERAIPPLLEGKDLLGCAQTGTGKTAAFAIPIMQILYNDKLASKRFDKIQALILTPTRELAAQIGESFYTYGKFLGLRNLVIFGGVSQRPQVDALQRGVDILIATPGRLLDLIEQKFINIHHVKFFVLDEADHMLDMGFIHDVRKIIALLPTKRQTMLFSATMPSEINKLVNTILVDPVKVAVTPVSSTVDIIQQKLYFVNKNNKKTLLIHLFKNKEIASALVFSRTKHGANKITKDLIQAGIIAEAIHGNKSQTARMTALHNFKAKKTRVLVATDIAARGIDIDELSHVINYDLPEVPETYVHRIGRTGRAGLGGIALSFCDNEEKKLLAEIQKLISKNIPIVEEHPWPLVANEPARINHDAPKKPFAPRRRPAARTSSPAKRTRDQ
ncbi:MAG: DEAD/DEAH box helicase [Hyphomonadaceae bacterium]|nr:DEAD/DEAH box helicase [Clostridia bacterium]